MRHRPAHENQRRVGVNKQRGLIGIADSRSTTQQVLLPLENPAILWLAPCQQIAAEPPAQVDPDKPQSPVAPKQEMWQEGVHRSGVVVEATSPRLLRSNGE